MTHGPYGIHILGCLCFVLVLIGDARAGVIHVPGQYNTIDAALQAAASGDTVLVDPGNYVEDLLTIGPGVTLLGNGDVDEIWIWLFGGLTLAPGAEPVRIEGVSVRGDAIGTRPEVVQAQNSQCEIVGNVFIDEVNAADLGAWLWGTGGGTIEGNWFETGHIDGVLLTGGGPWTVVNNTFAPACVLNHWPSFQFVSFPAVGALVVRQNTFRGDVAFHAVDFDVANNIFADFSFFDCPAAQSGSIHHNLFTHPNSQSTCLPSGGGEGNLWGTDPEFCDIDACDYRVSPTSPAVGAGESGETLGAWPSGCVVTSVEETEPGKEPLRAFPNPTTGVIHLDVGSAATSIVVFDVAGRALVRIPLRAGSSEATWDGRDSVGESVGPGVYFLKVETTSQATAVLRVVVK